MSHEITDTATIVDNAVAALGLSYDMTTDPAIVREVLAEMQLNDLQTSYAPMRDLLDRIASEPADLGVMLSQVRWGLIANAPAVVEFLAEALSRGWLTGSRQTVKAAHAAYVLEALTAAMCNSPVFFDEYVEHMRSKQKEIGVDDEHLFKSFVKMLPSSLNFFGTAKAISLNMAMVYFRVGRLLGDATLDEQSLDELHASGKISLLERKLLLPLCGEGRCVCNDWLRVNIYEAGITEHRNGFSDNALTSHVLAEHVLAHCHRESFEPRHVVPEGPSRDFYASLLEDEHHFPVVGLSSRWKSLYLTWNMAFILGELKNLHYLFPKLLIPSVLCSKSEHFLGARVISLWLAITSSLLLHFHGVGKVTGPEGRRDMAALWGEINRRHAVDLFETDLGADATALSIGFESRFTRPYAKLGKLVMEFMGR